MTSIDVDELDAPAPAASPAPTGHRALTTGRVVGTGAVVVTMWLLAAALPAIAIWLMEQSCSLAGGPHCLPDAPGPVMALSIVLVLASAPIAWLRLRRWWAWLAPLAAVVLYLVAATVVYGNEPLTGLIHGETWPWQWWRMSNTGGSFGVEIGSIFGIR